MKQFLSLGSLVLIAFSLIGCFSAPKLYQEQPVNTNYTSNDNINNANSANNASQTMQLDAAIMNVGNKIFAMMPENTTLAIISISSNEKRLSEYIINELTSSIVGNRNAGNRKLTMVSRQKIIVIQKELQFNKSEYVNVASAQSIGKMIGAASVITGSITKIGAIYRLNIQALKTETAEVQMALGYDILIDARLSDLINNPSNTSSNSSARNSAIPITGNEIIHNNSPNFIQVGDCVDALIGEEYYVASGQVNIYSIYIYQDSGKVAYYEAKGETQLANVAVFVRKDSGEVLSIVSANRTELIGGISVYEFLKMNTWDEAIRYLSEHIY